MMPYLPPEDDPTQIPEGLPVIAAEDSDDDRDTQGAGPLSEDALAQLRAITTAAESCDG